MLRVPRCELLKKTQYFHTRKSVRCKFFSQFPSLHQFSENFSTKQLFYYWKKFWTENNFATMFELCKYAVLTMEQAPPCYENYGVGAFATSRAKEFSLGNFQLYINLINWILWDAFLPYKCAHCVSCESVRFCRFLLYLLLLLYLTCEKCFKYFNVKLEAKKIAQSITCKISLGGTDCLAQRILTSHIFYIFAGISGPGLLANFVIYQVFFNVKITKN